MSDPTHPEPPTKHEAITATGEPAHDPTELHVHVVPPRVLLAVFAGLLVLTILTVTVTSFDFGRTINVWLALGIAVAKATLVALYFMHLRWDSPFNALVCVAAMFFAALFIGITVLDTKETYVNFQQPAPGAVRPHE